MADEKGRTNQQWLSMSVNNLLRNSICYFVMTFSFFNTDCIIQWPEIRNNYENNCIALSHMNDVKGRRL